MKGRSTVSFIAFVAVALSIIAVAAFNHPVRKQVGSNFLILNNGGDYLYLPATILYHDSANQRFEFLEPWQKMGFTVGGFYEAGPRITDGYVIKNLPGMAILWLPFFLAGHLLASIFGFPLDGFSTPYQAMIFIGGLCYILAGMWFLRRILVAMLGERIAAATLVTTFLTTGLFWISCLQSWSPEAMLFFLGSLGIWALMKFGEKRKLKFALLSGFAFGISCLIKPLALIFILVPVFWHIYNKSSWELKITRIFNDRWKILTATGCFLVPLLVPFFYWKAITGNYLFDPWGFADNVKLLAQYLPDLLFSGNNGLLVYSPVLVLMLPGYYILAKVKPEIYYSFFIPAIVLILLAGSLPPQWYTNGPGRYDLTGFLPLAAIPLGYAISWISSGQRYIKIVGAVIILLLSVVNIYQAFAFATRPGKPVTSFVHTLPDTQGYSFSTLCYYGFEYGSEPAQCQTGELRHTGKKSFKLTAEQQYSQGLTCKFSEISCRDSSKIRVSAFVYFGCAPHNLKVNLVISCVHDGQAYQYKGISLNKEPVFPNKWNHLIYDYWLPADRKPDDFVQVYFWNTGGGNLYIDDFKVDLLNPVGSARKE